MERSSNLFIAYVFIGGFATLIDLAVLYGLTEFFGIHYLISAAFSYLCGMLTNFSLNKVYNFRNKSPLVMQQFALFTIVALIGLALNQIILFVFVQYFGLWYMAAKIISTLVVMFWSFFGHKHLTFSLIK